MKQILILQANQHRRICLHSVIHNNQENLFGEEGTCNIMISKVRFKGKANQTDDEKIIIETNIGRILGILK